jgi:GNAT superfamily N-acetyltransferase
MRPLRPHLAGRDAFVARVDDVQRPEGYRLVAAFEDGDEAVAVAGFRVLHNLAWGMRALYVDDLSTHPDARRRGHSGALLGWLRAEARRLGCDEFHLDSGVGPERLDAHRLYFNAGMRIASYHFVSPVER